ncbi:MULTISPECIES: DUF4194 domain-containing protein [unclassified Variovorax]|uniref:DUF4194 domain-containing protein n=1 Tax=unclassified Variovorax TaxID=663243 RepID=UPI003F452141
MPSDDGSATNEQIVIPAFLRKREEPHRPTLEENIEADDSPTDADDPEHADQDLVLDAELAPIQSVSEDGQQTSDRMLFQSDKGELRGETRRALVALLAGPSVDGERQPKLWYVLKRDEAVLRSRLNELFLDMALDDENRVAFIRQVPQQGDTDIPVLLRRQPLTFLQSAALLVLRAALASASAAGQRAVVSGAELIADLAAYEDPSKSDKARFSKQSLAVVEALKKVSILRPIPGSTDRYEVSPTLSLLMPAEQLAALAKTYESLRPVSVGQEDQK